MNDEVDILRATLAALKESGAIRAQVELAGVKVNVEFPMDLSELRAAQSVTGTTPAPGAWKGPTDLDAAFQDNQ